MLIPQRRAWCICAEEFPSVTIHPLFCPADLINQNRRLDAVALVNFVKHFGGVETKTQSPT